MESVKSISNVTISKKTIKKHTNKLNKPLPSIENHNVLLNHISNKTINVQEKASLIEVR